MVKLLINEYRNRKQNFRNPTKKKSTLWQEIALAIEATGTRGISADMCDKKFRNLKTTFKKIKDNNKRSTTGTGRVNWEYYDDFLDLFSDDCTIFPPTTLDTFGNTGNSNSILNPPIPLPLPSVLATLENITPSSTDLPNIPSSSILPNTILSPSNIPAILGNSNILNMQRSKSTENQPKVVRNKTLCAHRKKILDIEKERLSKIETLIHVMKENNVVQNERNKLLKELVELKKKKYT